MPKPSVEEMLAELTAAWSAGFDRKEATKSFAIRDAIHAMISRQPLVDALVEAAEEEMDHYDYISRDKLRAAIDAYLKAKEPEEEK